MRGGRQWLGIAAVVWGAGLPPISSLCAYPFPHVYTLEITAERPLTTVFSADSLIVSVAVGDTSLVVYRSGPAHLTTVQPLRISFSLPCWVLVEQFGYPHLLGRLQFVSSTSKEVFLIPVVADSTTRIHFSASKQIRVYTGYPYIDTLFRRLVSLDELLFGDTPVLSQETMDSLLFTIAVEYLLSFPQSVYSCAVVSSALSLLEDPSLRERLQRILQAYAGLFFPRGRWAEALLSLAEFSWRGTVLVRVGDTLSAELAEKLGIGGAKLGFVVVAETQADSAGLMDSLMKYMPPRSWLQRKKIGLSVVSERTLQALDIILPHTPVYNVVIVAGRRVVGAITSDRFFWLVRQAPWGWGKAEGLVSGAFVVVDGTFSVSVSRAGLAIVEASSPLLCMTWFSEEQFHCVESALSSHSRERLCKVLGRLFTMPAHRRCLSPEPQEDFAEPLGVPCR